MSKDGHGQRLCCGRGRPRRCSGFIVRQRAECITSENSYIPLSSFFTKTLGSTSDAEVAETHQDIPMASRFISGVVRKSY